METYAHKTAAGNLLEFHLAGRDLEFPRLDVVAAGKTYNVFEDADDPQVLKVQGAASKIAVTPELAQWLDSGYRRAHRLAKLAMSLRSDLPERFIRPAIDALEASAQDGQVREICTVKGTAAFDEGGEERECPAFFYYTATRDGLQRKVERQY